MKNFNISKQYPKMLTKAYTKEYINQLQNQTNSLYEYLHYYNPEWRLMGINDRKNEDEDNKDLSFFIYDGTHRYENSLISVGEDRTFINISKLNFRWGFKNRLSIPLYYGKDIDSAVDTLNIGATIYKKDSYDYDLDAVDYDRTEFLSHFIVFESSLAQYIVWTISTEENKLKYTYHLVNELDFGLAYNIQIVELVPRYFYETKHNNNVISRYGIKYIDDPFDTTTLFDYININVRHKYSDTDWQPQREQGQIDYQYWCGATELYPQVVYENNNQYEDLIGDIILYERPGKVSEYQVRLDKNTPESGQDTIEQSFEVIFS